jgi:hypothetical protein
VLARAHTRNDQRAQPLVARVTVIVTALPLFHNSKFIKYCQEMWNDKSQSPLDSVREQRNPSAPSMTLAAAQNLSRGGGAGYRYDPRLLPHPGAHPYSASFGGIGPLASGRPVMAPNAAEQMLASRQAPSSLARSQALLYGRNPSLDSQLPPEMAMRRLSGSPYASSAPFFGGDLPLGSPTFRDQQMASLRGPPYGAQLDPAALRMGGGDQRLGLMRMDPRYMAMGEYHGELPLPSQLPSRNKLNDAHGPKTAADIMLNQSVAPPITHPKFVDQVDPVGAGGIVKKSAAALKAAREREMAHAPTFQLPPLQEPGKAKTSKKKGKKKSPADESNSMDAASILLGLAGSSSPSPTGEEGSTSAKKDRTPKPFPTRLTTEMDKQKLNSMHCFVREELLELFMVEAKEPAAAPAAEGAEGSEAEKHVAVKSNSATGRVGLRCIHCAEARKRSGGTLEYEAPMAVFYPKSIHELYRLITSWQRVHLRKCRNLPKSVRDTYNAIKETDKTRGKTQYWITSALKIGLVDSPARSGGVRFDPMVDPSQFEY